MGELLCQLDELLTLKLPVNLYCKGFCHTLGSWLELSWTKTGQNKKTLGVPQPWNWWFSKIRWLIVWLNKTIQRCYPDDCHQVYPRTESFMGPSTLSLLTRLLISNTLCSYFLFAFPCPLACFSHLYAVGLGRLENQSVWKANNYLSSRAWWGAGWRGGRGGWRPPSREEPNPSRAQVPPSYWAGPLFGTCQEWGWLARPRTWSVEAGGLGATEETLTVGGGGGGGGSVSVLDLPHVQQVPLVLHSNGIICLLPPGFSCLFAQSENRLGNDSQ